MSVKIEMDGMCKGCEEAELELSSVIVEQFDCTTRKLWDLRCIHEPVCRRWKSGKVSTQ